MALLQRISYASKLMMAVGKHIMAKVYHRTPHDFHHLSLNFHPLFITKWKALNGTEHQ
jgi:hypothetical protein